MPTPHQRLFRTALITSPVIGVAMATPIAVVMKVELPILLLMLAGITTFVFADWMLHLLLLRFSPWEWTKRWPRILLIWALTVALTTLLTPVAIQPDFIPISPPTLLLVRTANLLAVNTIIFILSELILTRDRQARLSRENAELRLAHLEAQFQLLKDQLNPHFLFNALGTARSLIRRNPSTAEEYLLRLSEFLRVSLSQPRDLVTLREELRLCADYVSLQQMRFQQALQFTVDAPDQSLDLRVPYFGLLTLCENAIKHNTMTPEQPLQLTISVAGTQATVTNNLQPRVQVTPQSRTGLQNLSQRHHLLTGHHIQIAETATHFTVTLTLVPA